MCARSMVNYGFKDLRIVNPKVIWPNKKAYSASAGAFDKINKTTKIYANIEESFKKIDVLFATSVRNRDIENIMETKYGKLWWIFPILPHVILCNKINNKYIKKIKSIRIIERIFNNKNNKYIFI